MPTALGEAGAAKATAAIARQMQKLLAADVIYESVTRPEINGKLADEGIEGDDVPKSTFVPDGTKWLDEGEVAKALGGGERLERRRTAAPGVHGLGLVGVSIGETELVAGSDRTRWSAKARRKSKSTVQNQGESTENGITVVVTANGKETTQEIADARSGRRRNRGGAADAGAGRRNDARSRSRTGARRAVHRQQRSDLHRQLRIV